MQDIHRFEATSVSCFSENNVDIIGLSDDDQDPDHFAVLMQLREDGRSASQCTELQTEDTERPVADAVHAIQLSRQQISIILASSMQTQLGYGVIEIGLPERRERQLLEQYLHLCFDDTPVSLTIED